MPVAIITGDCFLADDITRELIELGAELRFKPIWTEELVALGASLQDVFLELTRN